MTALPTTLHYNHQALDAIQMEGQVWLRYRQIVGALGFADTRSADKLYNRNRDEFTLEETQVVPLPGPGGIQDTRVFSLRGAQLLTILARTPQAKVFRRWILDLLEGRRRARAPEQMLLPGSVAVATETLRALDTVLALLEAGRLTPEVIRQLQTGEIRLSADPGLDHLAERFRAVRGLHREANHGYRIIAKDAKRMGYSWEAVKIAARGETEEPDNA